MDWLWNPDHLKGRELRDSWIAIVGGVALAAGGFVVITQVGTRIFQGHWAWYWAWWPF